MKVEHFFVCRGRRCDNLMGIENAELGQAQPPTSLDDHVHQKARGDRAAQRQTVHGSSNMFARDSWQYATLDA